MEYWEMLWHTLRDFWGFRDSLWLVFIQEQI